MAFEPAVKVHKKSGLGKELLLWFLALSLIPMALVSVISYRIAFRSILNDAEKSLKSVATINAAYVNSFFEHQIKTLDQQSQQSGNVKFMQELSSAYRASNQLFRDFTETDKTRMHVHERSIVLQNLSKNFDYYDILFIDVEGNILFTVKEEDDLGTNLFSGKYSKTLLATAVGKALESGRATFSDFERYEPSGGIVAGFLVEVMLDDHGDKAGLMAIQLSVDKIDQIMQRHSGLGETEDVYLIGADLRMRSNSALEEKETVLGAPVETMQTRLWKQHHVESDLDKHRPGYTAEIYTGPDNVPVLGIHSNLRIADIHFGIIVEIDAAEAFAPANRLRNIVVLFLVTTGLLVIAIAFLLARRIVRPIINLSGGVRRVADGDLTQGVNIPANNEIGELADGFNNMLSSLRLATAETEHRNWLATGQAGLDAQMRGDLTISPLTEGIISYITKYVNAPIGALFINTGNDIFTLAADYACNFIDPAKISFRMGEGLVGQAAKDRQILSLADTPDDFITVVSGLGEAKPRNIHVIPCVYNNKVIAVLELASFTVLSSLQVAFLQHSAGSIAITINMAQSRAQLEEYLEIATEQATEMEAQQEELRAANEELEDQTRRLTASEEELRAQQEELRAANEALQEKTHSLEEQRTELDNKNKALLIAQEELEKKAKDLEITNTYKSEFLANMSHELRTPLNSLLILAQDLAANRQGNLDAEQVESAGIVYNSGKDLLLLINEILDLAKIEAGKISLHLEEVALSGVIERLKANFQHVANAKALELVIEMDGNLPEGIQTDQQRLEQIIKNLMSNAIKFTEKGSVTVKFLQPAAGVNLSKSGLTWQQSLAVSVTDTGIGIPQEKIVEIFEAFQQVDGSISRRYGGTGLGLSISRELAKLLGGELQVVSHQGKGSTFTLYLPLKRERRKAVDSRKPEAKQETAAALAPAAPQVFERPITLSIKDDRNDIQSKDRVILIIEDDPNFAVILSKFSHERGFKCIHAGDGETGLELAAKFKPAAIILDVRLPGIQGWSVLDALKCNDATRHIPVHMMSVEEMDINAFRKGIIGYMTKPVSSAQLDQAFTKIDSMLTGKTKKLLVVEDDENQRKSILRLIGGTDVETTSVGAGRDMIMALQKDLYDCVILDLNLPDMSGFDVLKQLEAENTNSVPPIIVYTGKELSKDEQEELERYASSIIIKGVKSPERLLDETALFLHRVIEDLPKDKQKMIASLYDSKAQFQGKKILLVDDDMRNVFALSKILSTEGMEIIKAANGRKALDILEAESGIDLVLMDIMMPVMDGYTAMREIRRLKSNYRNVPILALTAKAMKEDRQKCIEAGANDYLPKPVDIDRLLSMLRVWLYR